MTTARETRQIRPASLPDNVVARAAVPRLRSDGDGTRCGGCSPERLHGRTGCSRRSERIPEGLRSRSELACGLEEAKVARFARVTARFLEGTRSSKGFRPDRLVGKRIVKFIRPRLDSGWPRGTRQKTSLLRLETAGQTETAGQHECHRSVCPHHSIAAFHRVPHCQRSLLARSARLSRPFAGSAVSAGRDSSRGSKEGIGVI